MLDVLIVGTGAVGSVVGRHLSAGGARVSALLRPGRDPDAFEVEHLYLDRTRRRWRPEAASTTADTLPKPDVVLLAIKGFPPEELAAQIAPVIDRLTPVVSLMNGLGHVEVLARLLPDACIGAGAAMVAVAPIGPDQYLIHLVALIELALLAEDARHNTPLRDLQRALVDGGLPCGLEPDTDDVAWRKLVWNIPMTGLSRLHRPASIGQLLDDPDVIERMERIEAEVLACAAALGHSVDTVRVQEHHRRSEQIRHYREFDEDRFDVELEPIFTIPLRRALEAKLQCPHWSRLVEEVLADRRCALGGSPVRVILDPSERDGEHPSISPAQDTIPQVFRRVVERCPGDIAAQDLSATRRFEELARSMDGIASALNGIDIGPGHRIGILTPNGIDFAEGMLGVIASGAVAVPLDPTLPAQRLAEIAEEVDLRVIIASEELSEVANTIPTPQGCLLLRELEQHASDPPSITGGDSGAVVLCTSGSTGRPKAILHTHASLLDIVSRHVEVMEVHGGDRLASFYNPGVYGATRDLLLAMCVGASLRIFPFARLGTAGVPGWIEDNQITAIGVVIPIFRAIVESLEPGARLESVRVVKCGGETIRSDDLRCFKRATKPGAWFLTGLSSTELGLSLESRWGHESPVPRHSLPLGAPFGSLRALVVDENGVELKDGVPGQLAFVGPHLAAGFISPDGIKRPELPKVPHGLGSWLTSDLVLRRNDGIFELLGRSDDMIKIRGHRLDLGEIESRALAIGGVTAAAAAVHAVGNGQQIVLHWARAESSELTEQEVRSTLRRGLPSTISPTLCLRVGHIPRTAIGKIDRKRLASMIQGPTVATTDIGRLVGKVDIDRLETILELVRRVVGVDEIKPSDRFSTVGGDSLGALRLLLDIEDLYGARIPFSMMEEDPSSLDLVRLLGAAQRVQNDRLIFEYDRRRRDGAPVLCLSGVGGSVMRYRNLVSEVARRRLPLRLIGARYPDPSSHGGIRSLGDLAAVIAEEADRNLERPPEIVCGYSWGGFVAPEVAKRLASPATPVIIDARVGSAAGNLRSIARQVGLSLLGSAIKRRRGVRWWGHQADAEMLRAARRRRALLAKHKPSRMEGPVVVVAGRSATGQRDSARDLGWASFVDGPLHCCKIDVPHGRLLLRDGAGPLAAILAATIERRWEDLDSGAFIAPDESSAVEFPAVP